MRGPIRLSPSDLTFLWSDCKRCFYLKVVYGSGRPAAAMPAIFMRIDRLMKQHFLGLSTADISPSLPAGRVQSADGAVQSQPVVLPGRSSALYIRGKYDAVLEFADGGFGVVDFKTTEPRPEHAAFYGRQLHAYVYALEHASAGKLSLKPVTSLGLLSVTPDAMERRDDRVSYLGRAHWQAVAIDRPGFLGFLDEVAALTDGETPPPADPDCEWCRYRDQARISGW